MNRTRPRLRTVCGASALAAIAALALVVGNHLHHRADAPDHAFVPPDDWTVRGFVRRGRGAAFDFTLRAQAAEVERARLGLFRIGVTRELHARGVRLDLLQRDGQPRRLRGGGIPSFIAGGALTSLRLDDVTVRVHEPTGDVFELRADRCETGIGSGGVITCRGRISAADATHSWKFDELRYDVGVATIVSARGRSDTPYAMSALRDAFRRIAAARLLEHVWPRFDGRRS